MGNDREKRPWPSDPWGGLMVFGVVLAVAAPVFLVSWLLFDEPGPGVVFGFFAGVAAVVFWVRRYEGEWTWGD
jgi:hypothetical protein